jgi:hypothetical protein
MKFIINRYKDIWNYFWQQPLSYISEEHSFHMPYFVTKIDVELILNTISFPVSDNIIVGVSGFCGLKKSMKSNHQVPEYHKGILKVEHNLKCGFAYGINDDDDYEYPVHVNTLTGWVCIGNPEKKGNAVEFINNCVAVIDSDFNFVSLWLKPQNLPDL